MFKRIHTPALLTCDVCEAAADDYVRQGLDRHEARRYAELEHYSIPHGGEFASYEAMQADTSDE